MTIYTTGRRNTASPVGPVGAMIIMALVFVLLYFVAKGIFTLLSWVAPILFIATLIMDHQVVVDYGKTVFNKLKTNFLFGIVLVLLTIFGFPIVAGYLFFRAYIKRKFEDQMGSHQENQEFLEYEIVEEDEATEEFLELPELEKQSSEQKNTDYDNMFD